MLAFGRRLAVRRAPPEPRGPKVRRGACLRLRRNVYGCGRMRTSTPRPLGDAREAHGRDGTRAGLAGITSPSLFPQHEFLRPHRGLRLPTDFFRPRADFSGLSRPEKSGKIGESRGRRKNSRILSAPVALRRSWPSPAARISALCRSRFSAGRRRSRSSGI
jgi:hypothetical protein